MFRFPANATVFSLLEMKTGTGVHPVTNSTCAGALLPAVKRLGNVAHYSFHFVPLLKVNGAKTQTQCIDFFKWINLSCSYVLRNSLKPADYNKKSCVIFLLYIAGLFATSFLQILDNFIQSLNFTFPSDNDRILRIRCIIVDPVNDCPTAVITYVQ